MNQNFPVHSSHFLQTLFMYGIIY